MMNNIKMNHKGFKGTVNLDIEINRYDGEVEGVDELITYEAADSGSLYEEFVKAVDKYLEK
jgi:predicted HicB family RNase H-like nuclease